MGLRKVILKFNILNHYRVHKNRKELVNRSPCIIASNCIGGILYNEYGLEFNSPFINTRVDSKSFVKIIMNFKEYMQKDLIFEKSTEKYPKALLGDVEINFVHYKSIDEARDAWNRRLIRINYDSLFFILNDCDNVSIEDLNLLESSKYKILLLTSKKSFNKHFCFYLDCYDGQDHVGNVLLRDLVTGRMLIEKYFNFTKWFNGEESIERCRVRGKSFYE